MVGTPQTRKPITSIRAEDLDAYPIWEFCHDEEDVEGMDETWIRPIDAAEIPKNAYGLTVAAHLAAANGAKFNGFVAIGASDVFEVSGFGIVFPQYCFIPAGALEADRTTFGAIVGATPDVVFPVRYRICVPLEGEPSLREGQID